MLLIYYHYFLHIYFCLSIHLFIFYIYCIIKEYIFFNSIRLRYYLIILILKLNLFYYMLQYAFIFILKYNNIKIF